jgi:hypothetical protein
MATETKPAAPEVRDSDFREGIYTGERVKLTPEQEKARKRRSMWIALGLIGFVIIVFVLTMTKMGAQILVRDL